MPPASWPTDPHPVVAAFERRHSASEAGALLFWAYSSAEALHYLSDLDSAYEMTRVIPGDHPPDLVDVAHVRWATGTCITALDLCAAGLARALGRHSGAKELDLGDFGRAKPNKPTAKVISAMAPSALNWIGSVLADQAFIEMKAARDALTHRRLPRHLYASIGFTGPDRRLDLQVGTRRVPAPQLILDARDLATTHLKELLLLLPSL